VVVEVAGTGRLWDSREEKEDEERSDDDEGEDEPAAPAVPVAVVAAAAVSIAVSVAAARHCLLVFVRCRGNLRRMAGRIKSRAVVTTDYIHLFASEAQR
jgi:hypothetical protein